MKFLIFLIFSIFGAIVLEIYLPEKWSLFSALSFIPIVVSVFFPSKKVYAKIFALTSTAEDFTRGWLITGFTGSGKTSALTYLLFQIFKNVPNFGAVFLDQKGVFWEIIERMAKHFGREGDLVLVRTNPSGSSRTWKPQHTINVLGDNTILATSYAAFLTDT